MKIVMIMSTLGRVAELDRFFRSLQSQSFSDFRIFLTNQNSDSRLDALLDKWRHVFDLTVCSSERGLSKGRNVALRAARDALSQDDWGRSIVCFPDDDCWYDTSTLTNIVRRFSSERDLSCLTIAAVDENGIKLARTAPHEDTEVTRDNCMHRGLVISYAIFMRGDLVERVGDFNETLGVGAGTPWGSGEESDFLIRSFAAGGKFLYTPSIQVHHPRSNDEVNSGRVLGYAMGGGRVLKLNHYPAAFVLKDTLRYIAIFVVKSAMNFRFDKVSLIRAYGHVKGYFSQ